VAVGGWVALAVGGGGAKAVAVGANTAGGAVTKTTVAVDWGRSAERVSTAKPIRAQAASRKLAVTPANSHTGT
jgi:hypothetical protein